MSESPANNGKPASDKDSWAQEQKQVKLGNSQGFPAASDCIKQAKELGKGYANTAKHVEYGSQAQATRSVPEHKYMTTESGAATGESRQEIQNKLAAKRK